MPVERSRGRRRTVGDGECRFFSSYPSLVTGMQATNSYGLSPPSPPASPSPPTSGVHLSYKFKSLLIDILRTNQWRKDGESMALKFAGMIDKADNTLHCIVIAFLTDDDGGSKRGRQLILGDYLKEDPEAETLAEELIDFVHWLNSHDKIREIFYQRQVKVNEHGTVYVYLVANLTRWTTHLVAFIRFRALKVPIRNAILTDRDDIIQARLGGPEKVWGSTDYGLWQLWVKTALTVLDVLEYASLNRTSRPRPNFGKSTLSCSYLWKFGLGLRVEMAKFGSVRFSAIFPKAEPESRVASWEDAPDGIPGSLVPSIPAYPSTGPPLGKTALAHRLGSPAMLAFGSNQHSIRSGAGSSLHYDVVGGVLWLRPIFNHHMNPFLRAINRRSLPSDVSEVLRAQDMHSLTFVFSTLYDGGGSWLNCLGLESGTHADIPVSQKGFYLVCHAVDETKAAGKVPLAKTIPLF
ncbi:hypothetical protein B0H14DRAFT_2567386 [Mycena olivaceomarginata]|nr:hypothetical protein B0H14DRAFT_2567386 [Mycena olivaceomarginata]